MKSWPVRESRITATAAARGWLTPLLRCTRFSGGFCDTKSTESRPPFKIDHQSYDWPKTTHFLQFTVLSHQTKFNKALAYLVRRYSTQDLWRRSCSDHHSSGDFLSMKVPLLGNAHFPTCRLIRVPVSTWAPYCVGQCRLLHCTPQHMRYFDEDFATSTSNGEKNDKILSKPSKKKRRLSEVKKTSAYEERPDADLNADTLRSIALAKQLLKGDQSSALRTSNLNDERQNSHEAPRKYDDGFCPTDHHGVAAFESSCSGFSEAQDESQHSISCGTQSHEKVSTSEFPFRTPQSSTDESCPKMINSSVAGDDDSNLNFNISSQCVREESSASELSSTSPSRAEGSHYSHVLPEPMRSSSFNLTHSSSYSPGEKSPECDLNDLSICSADRPSLSHEETAIQQKPVPSLSTPQYVDSTVSASLWDSSNNSSNLPEEDSSSHSSQHHRLTDSLPESHCFFPAVPQLPRTAAAACTGKELSVMLRENVTSPHNSRLLKVAVLGLPNAGKSSIINALTQNQICSTSRKAHTTRGVIRGVVTIGQTQLVFLDTPGVVTPDAVHKHKLPLSLVRGPEEAMVEADLLVVVVDAACRYAKLGLHSRLLRMLALHPNIPAVLCLNKVDLVKQKTSLLELAKEFTEGTVGGTSSHIDSRFTRPKHNTPFSSRNKTPKELVDEFFENLEEQKGECKNSYEVLQVDKDKMMLDSSEKSDPVMLQEYLDDAPVDSQEPFQENELLFSSKEQEEKVFVEHKPMKKLVHDLYNDEASSSGNILVKTDISSEEALEISATEVSSSDIMHDDRSSSVASVDVGAAQTSSSIMPLDEVTELTFSVSFEELQENNHLYVAPASCSALEACRPPLPFTEEDVLQGRVRLSEDQARDFVRDKKGWPLFQEVVFTSVSSKKGLDALRELLLRRARPAEWVYPPSLSTDQDPRQLAVAAVSTKFLNRLKYQVPYELHYAVEGWELGDAEVLHIGVRITCKNDRVAKMVVGSRGCNIVSVAKDAEAELAMTFKKDVKLSLRVSSVESEKRAVEMAEERKLIVSGSSPEEAQLIVRGMAIEKVKKKARILKQKGAVYDRSVGGLVFKREEK
ncbi:Small GTP-binding protein domain [Trinorchestia longiramus]|nr:Small GTP-binding protein domain [Trinorchestia longiramus]